MKLKYYIVTYGCQMNRSDSERIANILENMNYKKALKLSEADLVVVNMCSVRQSAVDRVYGLKKKFRELRKNNKKLKTILTGCISKFDLAKFKKFFDYILSIKTLDLWPEFLKKDRYFYYPFPRNEVFSKEFKAAYLKRGAKYSTKFSVFIPISSGCDNFCTFCIVPYVRGSLICRNHQEIIKETKEALKRGAKEIWLLGQNVNDYISPTRSSINFSKLLKMINKIPGKFWIRFTSPHPKNFSDELIETIAKCKKVTPYLNLPLQSGDDEILERMRRGYKIKDYKRLVNKIRSAFKRYRKGIEREIAISTDIIVGFPGETRKQFENTLKLIKEIKFDMAYIARYSPRPGTAAAKMKDNVSLKEKKRREKILTKELEKIILKKNKKYIGKIVDALIEKKKNEFLFGKTATYKTIKTQQDTKYEIRNTNLIGQFVKVKITDALPWGLKGELTK